MSSHAGPNVNGALKSLLIVAIVLSVPVTGLAVEWTGGLPNQLVHFYYLPVVASALFLPRRWAILLTFISILMTSPALDVVHRYYGLPIFYKDPTPWNLAGNGWIVRPLAFFAINILASRMRASMQALHESNDALRLEVAERQRVEHGLESALEAELMLEGQLEHQALHDPLTGLGNRTMFIARLDHALDRAQFNAATTGLIFMDTDDFKAVNDRWGHSTGDEVLIELGRRIGQCCSVSETAARLGGDEFAVILEHPESMDAVRAFAERVLEALERPIPFSHGELFLRCSLGVALADEDNRVNGTELLRQADIAMYMAKDGGKGRVEIYEPSVAVGLVERISLAQEMQGAVGRGEFVLHYQPCVALQRGNIVGVEALVRWNHPRIGILPPDEFIGLAEENGLIIELGSWVLQEATRQIATWNAERDEPLFVAINVSTRQLATRSFVDEVKAVLLANDVPARTLILEITETAVMADAELSLLRLRELKAVGVRIAVDDFGTGYSSLNYLRRFPVDVLKIDKAFVDEIDEQSTKNPILIRTIVEIGRTLGLRVVAEGIERATQLHALSALGCEQGQGFYFSRPLECSAVEDLLRRDHAFPAAEAA
ncbi:MAG: EAL domain-containing protein [Chloroflexota bacterium]